MAGVAGWLIHLWVFAVGLVLCGCASHFERTYQSQDCQVQGYTLYPQQDSPGNDISCVSDASDAAQQCSSDPQCQGFSNAVVSSYGSQACTKRQVVVLLSRNSNMTSGSCLGFYKKSCPTPAGYTFHWGKSAGGDYIASPYCTDWVTHDYAMAVDSAAEKCTNQVPSCVAFEMSINTTGTNLYMSCFRQSLWNLTDDQVAGACEGVFIKTSWTFPPPSTASALPLLSTLASPSPPAPLTAPTPAHAATSTPAIQPILIAFPFPPMNIVNATAPGAIATATSGGPSQSHATQISVGAMAGVITGGAAAVVLLILIIWWKSKKQRQPQAPLHTVKSDPSRRTDDDRVAAQLKKSISSRSNVGAGSSSGIPMAAGRGGGSAAAVSVPIGTRGVIYSCSMPNTLPTYTSASVPEHDTSTTAGHVNTSATTAFLPLTQPVITMSAATSLPLSQPTCVETHFGSLRQSSGVHTKDVTGAIWHRKLTNLIIPWSEIQLDANVLGRGGFGEVYKGTWQGVIPVAVKMLDLNRSSDGVEKLCREALLMCEMPHPCIASVYGVVDDADHAALVMKYYKNGALDAAMSRGMYAELSLLQRLGMAQKVASGMRCLHERKPAPIIHGDLKTSNLLIDDDGQGLVIADFGLARCLREGQTGRAIPSGAGTPSISPPEVFANPFAPRTTAGDVYAFGVVLFEIIVGRPAFQLMRRQELIRAIMSGARPSIPDDVPEDLANIIKDCWQQDPCMRPTFVVIAVRLAAAVHAHKESGDGGAWQLSLPIIWNERTSDGY